MRTVFDQEWFARHQRSLRMALNTPGLGRELRSALGIKRRERITRVLPHAVIVAIDPAVRVATFQGQSFIAQRLHSEFLPIWKMLHWFDMHVANRYAPALNLGFDLLTFYPDPDVEVTSVDGWVGRLAVDETFAAIRTGAGIGGTTDNGTDAFCYLRASAIQDQYDQLRRLFLLFNTAALGAGATISAATLSLWGVGKNDALGTCDLTLVASNTASNDELIDADFATSGTTSFGSVAYASFTANNTVYNPITVNGSGLSAISKTGVTKFGTRLEWDRSGTFGGVWVNGATTYYQANMAENASGQARAPKLEVTYTSITLLSALVGEPTVGGSVF